MEKTINININGQHASASALASVNATVGIMYCEFAFNDYWDAFPAKKAHFENTNIKYGTVTTDIINGRCKVPADVLRADGCIMVAIEGTNTDGQTERSAPVVIIKQYKTITDGVNTIEPTPDQYAQYVEEVGGAITEYFNEHKEEFKGDPGDDYVLTETDKIEIAGITVEEIKPLIDGKMEFYKVEGQGAYNNISYWHDGVRLYYNDLVEKYNDPKYFLYAEFEGLTFIPSLPPVDYDPILEFICTWIYGGRPHVARLVINSDNEGKYDGLDVVITSNLNEYTKKTYVDAQLQLKASTSELADVRESLNQKADQSEVDDVKKDLNDKVGFTDYASASKGGVVKSSTTYRSQVNAYGEIFASPMQVSEYNSASLNSLIGKGTLENVLAERLKEPQFELIEEITLTEDVTSFFRNAEPNGNPYNFKKLLIHTYCPVTASTSTCYFDCYTEGGALKHIADVTIGNATYKTYANAFYEVVGGRLHANVSSATSWEDTPSNEKTSRNGMFSIEMSAIKRFRITPISAGQVVPANTKITIYGIRA